MLDPMIDSDGEDYVKPKSAAERRKPGTTSMGDNQLDLVLSNTRDEERRNAVLAEKQRRQQMPPPPAAPMPPPPRPPAPIEVGTDINKEIGKVDKDVAKEESSGSMDVDS